MSACSAQKAVVQMNWVKRLQLVFLIGILVICVMDSVYWVLDVQKDLLTLKSIQNTHSDAISGIAEATAYRFTVDEKFILKMYIEHKRHLDGLDNRSL